MPRNDPPLAFPTCGVAGGWRDPWDDPDEAALIWARIAAEDPAPR